MNAWATAALDLLYPALCPLCARRLGVGRRDPLCAYCWSGIERVAPPWCLRCGMPWPVFEAGASPPARCPGCVAAPPAYDYARAAGVYAGTLREALHELKFGGRQALARPLSALILEQCGDVLGPHVDALVPVPLAADRERARGFNQAALLAGHLAAASGVALRSRWLRRRRSTRPQTDLGASERRGNVAGAFRAWPHVHGHVVLVDDIITTGATAAECARTLRAAGAHRVGVLAVARVSAVTL